jgi:hypothetical protein
MSSIPIDATAHDRKELNKALSLLGSQGYFSEYEVRLGISNAGRSSAVIEWMQDYWDGKLLCIATECGDEGWIYSCFDPAELRIATVHELVRDEAELQRKLQL